MKSISLALVHHPVLDKANQVVTSAITNIDLHDIARTARTYDCTHFFVTTPISAQRQLAATILSHWTVGTGGERIPSRKEALSRIAIVGSLDEAIASLGDRKNVHVWTTSASRLPKSFSSFGDARDKLATFGDDDCLLLVFGTSWGLAPEIVARADAHLPPIVGRTDYNHLSVRAACAIIVDRLLGARD
jgi:hypothetical protein